LFFFFSFVFDANSVFPQAYKEGDGTRVLGRRVLVDVERGKN
jgi:hypothetical protein